MKPDFKAVIEADSCAWKRCRQKENLEIFSKLPDGSIIHVCKTHMERYLKGANEPEPIVVANSVQAEIAVEQNDAESTLESAKQFEIANQSDFDFVSEILVDVKTKAKRLEEKKHSLVDPINQSLKAARALFAPAEKALSEIEAVLKSKVAIYTKRLEAARVTARAQIDEAATSAEIDMSLQALAASAPPEMPKGVSTREVWSFRVLNTLLVPREFLTVDLSFVRLAIQNGTREIPGIEIYKDVSVAVKAGA